MRGIATPTTVWSSAASRSASATPSVARIADVLDKPWVIDYLLQNGRRTTTQGYRRLRQDPFRNKMQDQTSAQHLRLPAPPPDPARIAAGMVRCPAGREARNQRPDGPERHHEIESARLPGRGGAWCRRRLPPRLGSGHASAPARRRRGGC